MSGSSNGGMFAYAQMDKLNDIIASFGPVVGTPVLGFPASAPLDPPGKSEYLPISNAL